MDKPESTLSRRTVVKGAAWSVPVIAVSAAAPAMAASVAPCPTIPDFGSFVWAIPASGQLNPSTGHTGPATVNGVSAAESILDGKTSAGPATVTVTTTLSLVAGTSYTLSFGVMGRFADGNGSPTTSQSLAVSVGGSTIYRASTRPQSDPSIAVIPTGVNWGTSFMPVTVTFTATATGDIPLVFTFQLPGMPAGWGGSDDIRVSQPALLCP